MAIRKIAQLGEPVLRRPAEPVPLEAIRSERVQSLIEDMVETMRDADGAGIAAPQVYESLSLCVIEVNANPRYPAFPRIPLLVLVNPIVEIAAGGVAPGTLSMYEGCLSVTGIRGRVTRPRRVRVRALDRNGNPLDFEWEGIPAAVVQHETDHLNGVLFVDRADPKTLTFLREYERHVPIAERIVDSGATASG
ncbi:MAG TPA: peptide deformylase [Polyangiaceae bacterium]|nr:peptide deformylase [Polyangiaceae bacterium]